MNSHCPERTRTILTFGAPGGFRYFLAFLSANLGAICVFTAVFCAIGVLIPGRAMVAGLIYAVAVETTLSCARP